MHLVPGTTLQKFKKPKEIPVTKYKVFRYTIVNLRFKNMHHPSFTYFCQSVMGQSLIRRLIHS
jgi:hypothetical protein